MKNKRKKSNKSVEFSHIEFHEFPLTIGDNPSVSGGVPITLSGKRETCSVVGVDFYECYRRPRRSARDLILPREDREIMLLENGCKREDIARAVRISRKLRHDREHSYYNKGWDKYHETLESASRKMKKLICMRRSSNELWRVRTVAKTHVSYNSKRTGAQQERASAKKKRYVPTQVMI